MTTQAPGAPTLARTRIELDAALRPVDRAVVMTMGALHDGHLSLVREARARGEQVVVTIFVNPLQFGPTEDLDRYPRDLAGDLARLTGPGLLGPGDVVFAPEPAEVYPDGDPVVRVSAGAIGEVYEGAIRPGHLDGVLTVVLKLMHLTRPSVALFGRKDVQQLVAVGRMVRDLDLDVTIVPVPTVRDDDGLALSSRNAYLSAEQRPVALGLSRALAAGEQAAARGDGTAAVRAATREVLTAAGVDADYVALVDPQTFADLPDDPPQPGSVAVLAVAGRVGGTRLIDNTDVRWA
ncbi:pantoate--beta-alanine ligase [Cellulomonas denverensis]|uniref:Pantothenate synthetase n=1 Tax=Cellulomonas denverensis TaxID=264297 RepID=A0A7X6QXV6_9CELL|nr:pantoate--beta-alanine ligase [Cellulomonas denverensis]NKY21547.1 pantoate--beta-alanine ligase [Cellulomonas denverensis]GIG25438.1 pantothenate synthetase [Cellulomonas denverensis]